MIENTFIQTSGEQEMKKSKLLDFFESYIIKPLKETFAKSESIEKTKYADCIVRNELGQILLLHRTYTDDFEPGKWSFPGGHVDSGEDSMTAAHRELMEETGFDSGMRFIERKEKDNCIIDYFEAFVIRKQKNEIIDGQIILDIEEHRGWEWVNPEKIKEIDLVMDLGSYVDQLISKLFPITILEPKYTNPEEKIAMEGGNSSLTIDQAWEVLQKAFNEDQISEEEYLKGREKYLELKKAECLETLAKAFDQDLITEEQYLGAIEKGGKSAVIGEKRMFAGREYIKTTDGWKFHGKDKKKRK